MRLALSGLAVLAGIGVGVYMGANHIVPSGQVAQQAFDGIGSLVRSVTGGVQSATVNLGGRLPGSSAKKDAGNAGRAGSLGGDGSIGSTGGTDGSQAVGGASGVGGQKATSGSTRASGTGAGAAANSGTAAGGTGNTGAAAGGNSAAITTNNAPPPDPTILDGVQVRYDPYKPSDGAYPQLAPGEHVWVDVSVDQQLLYILDGDKVVYTMVTSTGLDTDSDNSTPLGVYHVQGERGTWFYSQQYSEGAQYWTSWLGHGIFLFHTVPMDSRQHIIPEQAALLGHKASHGCFHLTVPDAQWVYNNIPQGTTVVVEQAPVALENGHLYQPSAQQSAAVATPYIDPNASPGATTDTQAAQGGQPPQNAKV